MDFKPTLDRFKARPKEALQNLDFSPEEVRMLLRADEKDPNRYPALEALYHEVLRHFPNIPHLEMLRKILEGKQKAFDSLLYFKRLEQTFLSKVEKTVQTVQKGTRAEVAALGTRTQEILKNLDEETLKKIRLTGERDLEKGINLPDEKTIQAFVNLVREEVKNQVSAVQQVREEKGKPSLWRRLLQKRPGRIVEGPSEKELEEDRLADLLEKATYLIDFIADHFSQEPRKKMILRAMLLASITEKQREKNIEELYQRLSLAMQGKESVEAVRKSVEEMIRELEKGAEADQPQHLKEIIGHFASDLELSEEEARKIIETKVTIEEGDEVKTFEEAVASHIAEIESARVHLELMHLAPNETFAGDKLTPEERQRSAFLYRASNKRVIDACVSGETKGLTPREKNLVEEMRQITRHARERTRRKQISERMNLLASEVRGLRSVIDQYRERASDIEKIIDEVPEDLHNVRKKRKLKAASEFLIHHEGRNPTGIKIELSTKKDDTEALDRFIAEAEATAKQKVQDDYHGAADPSVGPARESTIELLRKNFFGYDYFAMVKEREMYSFRTENEYIEDNPNDPSDKPLSEIRQSLARMSEISEQNFRDGATDQRHFEEEQKAIQKILDREKIGEGEQKRIKKLPPAEYELWTALIHEKRNREIFAQSLSLGKLPDAEHMSDEQLRGALEALYKDRFLRSPEKQNLAKKFSKIMMIDHPVSMIRFSAADKKPMALHGAYLMHENADGKPVTFKQRSKELVKQAKAALENQDFLKLDALFDDYDIGERLYTNALFFPVTVLTNASLLEGVIYKADRKKDTGAIIEMKLNPLLAPYRNYFSAYAKKGEENCTKARFENEKPYEGDWDLRAIPGRIVDDVEYQKAFDKADRDKMLQRENSDLQQLTFKRKGGNIEVFRADGTPVSNKELYEELRHSAGGEDHLPPEVKALELPQNPGEEEPRGATLTKERLEQLQKESPLICARAGQWNSELMGRIHGGAQHAMRFLTYDASVAKATAIGAVSEFFSQLTFYSPMHVYLGVFEFIQNWEQRYETTTKFWTYNLLHEMFKGTIVGSEFRKQMESTEHHRVEEFTGAMKHYGHQEVIDKLYNAQDMFEFKAALTEGYENRGIITDDHILTHGFINALNKFHHHGHKIHCPYSDEEMRDDPESKIKMLEEIEKSVDAWWGRGTFQRWKTAGVSKNETYKKDAIEKMKSYLPDDKERIYDEMWKRLQSDAEIELMKKDDHVGTIVGTIEQDMIEGKFDTGITYALLQGFICAGIIKKEHVGRLQFEHANDFPIYSILTPQQAELSGLTEFWKANRHKPLSHALDKGNDFCRFFQGEKALPLSVTASGGKWKVPTSKKAFDELKSKGKIQTMAITAHQLQKNREAQEEFYKRMDNSCIQLFLPPYKWSQIKAALRIEVSGNLDKARSHDIVSGYRGIHTYFTANMQALNDKSTFPQLNDPLQFMRSVWFAYDAICKTSAMASHLASMKDRTKDFKVNDFDASPNYDEKYRETRPNDGISNFQKMILTNEGVAQRMQESKDTLDSDETGLTDELRKEFKLMAGFQHVRILGVNPDNGKNSPSSYIQYDQKTFDPHGKFKDVIKAFVKNVGQMADARGIGAVVRQWLGDGEGNLGESQMANFATGMNNTRIEAMGRWYQELQMN